MNNEQINSVNFFPVLHVLVAAANVPEKLINTYIMFAANTYAQSKKKTLLFYTPLVTL